MGKEKKIWFMALSGRLWIPISLEGWGIAIAFVFALFLIFKINGVSDDVAFTFSEHWPMLLELAVITAALYAVSRRHVDKRY